MSKRLQIILRDSDYREIQRIARARHMSTAEWVRGALEAAKRREPANSTAKKLATVRAAVRHAFPVADIDTMLAEIRFPGVSRLS